MGLKIKNTVSVIEGRRQLRLEKQAMLEFLRKVLLVFEAPFTFPDLKASQEPKLQPLQPTRRSMRKETASNFVQSGLGNLNCPGVLASSAAGESWQIEMVHFSRTNLKHDFMPGCHMPRGCILFELAQMCLDTTQAENHRCGWNERILLMV
ncbi:hypothetical protein SRHO_G00332090 [Serrasalmus rhombeus]